MIYLAALECQHVGQVHAAASRSGRLGKRDFTNPRHRVGRELS